MKKYLLKSDAAKLADVTPAAIRAAAAAGRLAVAAVTVTGARLFNRDSVERWNRERKARRRRVR